MPGFLQTRAQRETLGKLGDQWAGIAESAEISRLVVISFCNHEEHEVNHEEHEAIRRSS
jgi:hypothetical protein